jgi:hypothetical protein
MKTTIDPKTDHENTLKFHKHLEASEQAVWRAAQWLQSNGRQVLVMPITKTPTHAQWKQHADSGDLYIQQRIEVKRRGVHFTGPHDWPHGDIFFVCAKHSWDRAKPKPHAYMIFNSDMTHVAIVLGESHAKWTVVNKEDSRYKNYRQDFYCLPTKDEAIQWVEVNAANKESTSTCPITGEQKTAGGDYVF